MSTPDRRHLRMTLGALLVSGLYESCTPAADPVAAASPTATPTATPEEAFRAWVLSYGAVGSLVRWGGQAGAAGDELAFEALFCRPDHGYATWLVELVNGRRWSVTDGSGADCVNPPTSPPAFVQGPPRATFTGGFVDPPERIRVWGLRDGHPAVVKRWGGFGHDDFDYRYDIDMDACTETGSSEGQGAPHREWSGRPAGCGGFGEIPLRDAAHPTGSLRSQRQWGDTSSFFDVFAEVQDDEVSLVATVPEMDAPAPPGVKASQLARYDHFELWLRGVDGVESSRYGIQVDPQLRGAEVVPLDGAPPGPEVRAEGGRLRLSRLGPIYDQDEVIGATERFTATLVFVDGDGARTVGFSATGSFLDGRPHPYNRVASPGWRAWPDGPSAGSGWEVRAEPPAAR